MESSKDASDTKKVRILKYLKKNGESFMHNIYTAVKGRDRHTRRIVQQLEESGFIAVRYTDCCRMKCVRLVGDPIKLNTHKESN